MKDNEQKKFKIVESVLANGADYSQYDTLGFSSAKEAFLKVIERVIPPITIGFYGAWGSGKSRMIEALASDLNSKGNDYLTLVFDAWKYKNEHNLVLPLMCALERKCLPKTEGIKDSAKKIVASVAFVMANQFLKNKAGIDIKEIKESLQTYEDAYTYYKKYDDEVSAIENEYREFIKFVLEKTKKAKLIIFIDNLDRCLPDIVLNLLEDISAFLKISGVSCIYVLAMDKENVVKAIKHRYPGFVGMNYLEKIVQIGLSMPTSIDGGIDNWINHLQKRYMDGVGSVNGGSLFGHDAVILFAELKKLKGFFESGGILNNPRRIERFVNKWLVLEIMGYISYTEDKEDVVFYIFCILLKEYFPDTYDVVKTERDSGYLDTLITWSKDHSKTPKQIERDILEVNTKILNKELADQYIHNDDFYRFLNNFSAPRPSQVAVFAKKILEIKEKLDLVD